MAGDRVVLDLFERADLLVGVGFEPVESDKLWHHTMPLVSVGPVSIAAGDFRPRAEAVGDVPPPWPSWAGGPHVPHDWEPGTLARFREDLERVLRPATKPRGLSGYELTRALRALFPRDTVLATDVGSIKSITSQAWAAYEPLTFFESNGLSAMSYSFPAAMAARLEFPDRPVLCTIGDGGFGMTHAEIETCVRERIHFIDRRLQRQRAQPHRRGPAEPGLPDLRRALRAGGLRGGGGGNGRLVTPRGDAGRARIRGEGRAGASIGRWSSRPSSIPRSTSRTIPAPAEGRATRACRRTSPWR